MSFIAKLSPNVSIAVIGFPIIVIVLKEYQESLIDIIIKNIKKGIAVLDNRYVVLTTTFSWKQITKKESVSRLATLRNLYPDGNVENIFAKP